MKKGIIIFLATMILILAPGKYQKLYADEATNLLLVVMAALDEKRNMLMTYAEELKEKYDWLEAIETIEKIDKLLDLTICSEETFYLYGAISNDMDCFKKIEFEQVLFDYSASLDWLYLALSSLSMESGERIRTLDQAIDYVEKLQNKMNHYNTEMESSLRAEIMKNYIYEGSGDAWLINRY
jgi:hypothetical protein